MPPQFAIASPSEGASGRLSDRFAEPADYPLQHQRNHKEPDHGNKRYSGEPHKRIANGN
jgi:hypothetical protein